MVLSSSWLLSLKVMFMSTGVLTVALFFKVSVPLVMDFSASKAPVLWSSFLSWLRPPYLYLIINFIILGIAASSRFFQNHEVPAESHSPSPSDRTVYDEIKMKSEYDGAVYDEIKMKSEFGGAVYDEIKMKSEFDGAVYGQHLQRAEEEIEAPVFVEKSVVVSGAGPVEVGHRDETWKSLGMTESLDIPTELESSVENEKPLVSAHFGRRKPIKASPEGGRALRVTKSKRNETMENTWKAITEGRAMPLTRHLKKLDTWENHDRQVNVDPSPVKKSETFKDRTNYQLPLLSNNSNSPSSGGKLRKEPSLSQEELNRRVEAFIKKFNEEMRLQRQESLKQYQEMINRGV
ncbi:uncharacterized protein LOC123192424 [Mangifera indica]|uniref:uncharacterized protein LOC123192424 n=1 Tax=Mangifera indica TaxID=29780 RepID=UPI001CFA8DFF|nr:uncharacterized protein LOC123192424 [Mangifera indica]